MSAVVLQVTALGATGTSSVLSDGEMVPMLRQSQGAMMLFVGVRALNVESCGAKLSAFIRDEKNQDVKFDQRNVNLAPAPDGFGTSTDGQPSTFANLALCPNGWSATNVEGSRYDLTLTLTDSAGRTGTKTLRVIPTCAEPANFAQCQCICQAKYTTGQSCASDASAD
jgi:hypothetical protein